MLSKRLKELRTKKGVSQQAVANSLQVSRQVYNNYELGKREPSYDMIKLLSDYFSVSIDYLLSNDDINNSSQKKDSSEEMEKSLQLKELEKNYKDLSISELHEVSKYIKYLKSLRNQ